MSHKFMFRNFLLALGLTAALVLLTVTPAFAQTLQSDGEFCAGNNLTVASGQNIESLLVFGCNVTIEQGATVRGDLADFGSNINIAGTIGGDIVTFGGNVMLGDTAIVNGEIWVMGGNVRRAPGATVRGDINTNRGNFPIHPFTGSFTRNWGFDLLGGIVTALAFAALGALVVIFAPNATRRVSDAAQTKPLNAAGVGCLTVLVLPILCILLFITIIGIPVTIILGVVSAAAWIFGSIGIGLLAGEKILQALKARDILPVVAVILGVVLLMFIGQVPIIGWLISFIVGLIGLGAVVLTRFGTRTYPTAPGMMLTPAVAGAGPSVPGTYTPSAADVAAWEEKARQAQNTASAPPAIETKMVEPPPIESKADTPPSESEEPKSNV